MGNLLRSHFARVKHEIQDSPPLDDLLASEDIHQGGPIHWGWIILASIQGEKPQFRCGLVSWKMPSRTNRATELGVQRFNGVGRVNQSADVGMEGKEGYNLVPVASPALSDRRVSGPIPRLDTSKNLAKSACI
jgi:hypothetical protein